MNDWLWTEKYRPKTVEECILPDSIKGRFQEYVNTKNVPHLILTGSSGIGKTSVARAMLLELNCDYLKINASKERNHDVVKEKICNFASTVAFSDGRKYVILDEADGMSPAAQDALKGVIEDYSENCGFIFICNNLSRIIPAIISRCDIIDFTISKEEFPKLASRFLKLVEKILIEENVKYEKSIIGALIKKFYPDWRHVLVVLQSYAVSHMNLIDTGILADQKDDSIEPLVSMLKGKKWTDMRKWVGENASITTDFHIFCRNLQRILEPLLEVSSWPALTILINDYDQKHYFVMDREINVVAFLSMLMSTMTWR
jgi:DNA polymerase III delta prime subunit